AELEVVVEITLTSGATEAVFSAIHAVVGAGDEVIVLVPAYDCYEPGIVLDGARAVHVPLDAVSFTVDWERVGAAITSR
ncbi:aminotransferase class I/II-fold pyridoxal phosphate-dependent enzyme, partial [Xylella fastidiosa]|uniref:aminotransferase class I/II-fold pyridoxal phosphate-dependent enzyme n=1 Tax=Xylella fastidiosa TaxID=2371 RepID=UPI0012AD725B